MISEIKALSNEKKQHLVAVVLGTLASLSVVYFVLISPSQDALKKLGTQIADAEKKYSEADRLRKRADAVHDELEKLNDHLAGIEAGMVPASDLVQWIRSTEVKFRAQAPYKVEIPNFPFRGQGDMAMIPDFPYKTAAYAFTGSAYYHDLGRYLADWENQFPYMRVLNLDLSPEDAGGSTTSVASDDRERLSFSFEVSVLIKPPKRN
ncbi:MAG: hypothetical protein EBS05_10830 [Proteobacteria bacterium]|nr:hypothetical protein [Pseudomonadota bacterium]